MAVVINKASDNVYIGNLKATATVTNGVFVVPAYLTKDAAVPATDAAADGYGLLLAYAVNTKIEEEVVADSATNVLNGDYLRLKAVKVGDVFTTDQFKGTYATIAVGDIFAAGDLGTIEAIGIRTPVLRLQVVEKTTLYAANALKVIVIAN